MVQQEIYLRHAAVIVFGLCQVFEPFGPVELVQLPTETETGQCKGYGFVQVRENFKNIQQVKMKMFAYVSNTSSILKLL